MNNFNEGDIVFFWRIEQNSYPYLIKGIVEFKSHLYTLIRADNGWSYRSDHNNFKELFSTEKEAVQDIIMYIRKRKYMLR